MGSFVLADDVSEQTVVPVLSSVFQSTGNSIYIITLSDSNSYDFYTSTYNLQNGGLVQTFYNVDLNTDGLKKSGNITYSILSQKEEKTIPLQWFNRLLFLGYQISDTVSPVENIIEVSADDTVISQSFTGALSGVINNTKANLSIDSEFVNNYSETGASSINNNDTGVITSITSTFLGNYSLVNGGVLANSGNVTYINSMFLGNYTNQNGVIYNTGTIDRINSDFIGNYAQLNGGAIYNNGTISEINSNFISNSSSNGGAIYNAKNGVITNITSTFVNNFSKGDGGAIYNLGTIGTIRNSSFLANYSSVIGKRGGAIYSESDLNFLADGSTIEFTGNYVLTENGKLDEAIYINDANSVDDITLTFSIKDGGTVVLNDSISGADLINVGIKGVSASNDTFKLFNQINNSAVSFQNVKLDVLNGIVTDYNFVTSSFKDEVLFDFDLSINDSGKLVSDTITTNDSSKGVLTLNKINLVGVDLKTILEKELTVKIIISDSNRISLALSTALENEISKIVGDLNLPSEAVSMMSGNISADANWTDNWGTITNTYGEKYKYLGIAEDNKSFGFIYKYNVNTEDLTDVLVILNKAILKDELGNVLSKSFKTDSSMRYTLTHNLGETQGELTLKGYSYNHSEIDLDGFNGFELISSSVLNLKNLKLLDGTNLMGNSSNLIVAKSHQAVLNLVDAYLDGNIVGSGLNDSRFSINISGEDVTTITGIIKNANVNLTGGRFRFGKDTFADSSVTLKTDEGVIDLADNSINQYNISELISSKSVDYMMDMKLENSIGETLLTSDSLKVGKYSLGGAVKIQNINFIDELASLNLNTAIKNVIPSIGLSSTSTNGLKLATDVVSDEFLSVIESKYSESVDLFNKSTTVLYSDYVGAEGSQNILLELVDNSNNSEIFVSEIYHRIDSFDKFLIDGNYVVNSNDEMYDNVFVTAFYRDVLVNNSGKGLNYIIKYLEIQDNNASKSVGDILRLTLEQNITNSVTRTFKLVKDFTLTKDTSSINVTYTRSIFCKSEVLY